MIKKVIKKKYQSKKKLWNEKCLKRSHERSDLENERISKINK